MSRYGAGSGVARRIDDDGVVSKGKGDRNRKARAAQAANAEVDRMVGEWNAQTARHNANRAARRAGSDSLTVGGHKLTVNYKGDAPKAEAPKVAVPVQRAGLGRRGKVGLALAATGAGVGGYALHRQKQTTSKRLGVAPVLARRTALVGTGARRVVTGDKVNARRVIGKSDVVEKFSIGQAFTGFKSGFGQARGKAGPLALSSGPASRSTINGGVAGIKTGQGLNWAAKNKKALGIGAGLGGAGGIAVAKRRFDPEDRRRHRAGVQQGLLGAAGLGALGNAARLSNEDTRRYRASRGITGIDIDALKPNLRHEPQKTGEKMEMNGPYKQPHKEHAHRLALAERDYRQAQAAHADLGRKLKSSAKAGTVKGRVIGGRAAGYGGAGLALLAGAGAMGRTRNQDRWD